MNKNFHLSFVNQGLGVFYNYMQNFLPVFLYRLATYYYQHNSPLIGDFDARVRMVEVFPPKQNEMTFAEIPRECCNRNLAWLQYLYEFLFLPRHKYQSPLEDFLDSLAAMARVQWAYVYELMIKIIFDFMILIKNFSSPKINKFVSDEIKIWFEPMFFYGFFCGFERCGSTAFPNFRPPSPLGFGRASGGTSSAPAAAKAVRTNSRILRPVGLEPTTNCLRGNCSAIELWARKSHYCSKSALEVNRAFASAEVFFAVFDDDL